MGGGLEADLSQGAVRALWGVAPPTAEEEWHPHPVLLVVDVRHVPDGTGLRPAAVQRYRLRLSDGVYSQHAELAPTLNHLATGNELRRGSVVRLLRFVPAIYQLDLARAIVITELEILQTESALIQGVKRYKPTRNSRGFEHYF